MTSTVENKMCYFCDETYPHHISFVKKYDDTLSTCYYCEEQLPINYDNRENGKCCACFEETKLVELPTCSHKLCLKCCKTTYFGSTINERPIHWREITEEPPVWPYNDKKEQEYYHFEHVRFNYEKHTYEELVAIRNRLIAVRSAWMNTEAFINYENYCFMYHTKVAKIEKEWDEYDKSKTRGDGVCPLCSATPV